MTKHDTLTQDVKTKASELRDDVAEAVQAKADRTTADLRDAAVDHVTSAANAADAAAAEFDPNSLQARAAHQVADQVEGIANRLRGTDLNTLTRDVSTFARENPALFIGGAALLGFAATRFLKARDPQCVASPVGEADPWGTAPTTGGFDVSS